MPFLITVLEIKNIGSDRWSNLPKVRARIEPESTWRLWWTEPWFRARSQEIVVRALSLNPCVIQEVALPFPREWFPPLWNQGVELEPRFSRGWNHPKDTLEICGDDWHGDWKGHSLAFHSWGPRTVDALWDAWGCLVQWTMCFMPQNIPVVEKPVWT